MRLFQHQQLETRPQEEMATGERTNSRTTRSMCLYIANWPRDNGVYSKEEQNALFSLFVIIWHCTGHGGLVSTKVLEFVSAYI